MRSINPTMDTFMYFTPCSPSSGYLINMQLENIYKNGKVEKFFLDSERKEKENFEKLKIASRITNLINR